MDEVSAGFTTTGSQVTEWASFLAGFIAAEGCFTRTGRRFRFAVVVGGTDAAICSVLAEFLGRGTVRRYGRRKAHYNDEVAFAIGGIRDLVETVVPFMDAHLPESYKRSQYLAWRRDLLRSARQRCR